MLLSVLSLCAGLGAAPADIVLENPHVRIAIAPDGGCARFEDRRTGRNHLADGPPAPLARLKVAGADRVCDRASHAAGRLTLGFGEDGPTVVLRVRPEARYLRFEVVSVSDPDVDELAFLDIRLADDGSADGFQACVLALNLQTDVPQLPEPSAVLQARCVRRFGLVGARAALIATPEAELRQAMKDAVLGSRDLPHSPLGGPWALEGPLNRSSYLFNFGGLSEQTVDEWIARANALGFNQIQFHGGSSFRFGDCALDPATYPDGLASMRRVTDRLHAAGLCAGMQPYAFFIDKRSSWVTPKPDPRLAKSETYTLAEDLTADAVTVPVLETTASVSTVTGFFVHNSVIVQIDDELIIYTGATKQAPYAFTGCQRGALGTTAAPHRRGATVGHLKECFGLLVPDPETTLFEEVAAKTAELFNEGGFDCIYLDALDGEGILGGNDNAWHYGSKYVFEIWKRLKRPAVMEMSTFHHHLWFVRSRMGAWDHPTRSHKRFIDMHVEGNRTNQRMFLPSNLGWWAFMAWQGSQTEPTYSDDIEYLCCKALGTDSGLSMTTFDPAQPAQARLAAIVRRYETLRHAGTVPEAIRARLRQPGQDYSLVDGPGGAPAFVPMRYARHRVLGDEVWATQWTVRNEFAEQPAGLRIEALSGAAPYEEPDAVALAGFDVPDEFPERAAAAGVSLDLLATRGPNGEAAGLIHASSSLGDPRGSWARLGKRFDPPLKLGDRQALGVWVRGDGKGEVLNFQLMSPEHLTSGIGEHYVIVDFEGWRYFELIEPDSDLYADLAWPYGGSYSVYRESVTFDAIDRFSLWINHLPPGEPVECAVAPVRALPLRTVSLQSPAVTIGGHTIGFPVTIETGSYLESLPGGPARVYDPQGRLVAEVAPEGALPALGAGDNAVGFSCGRGKVAPRARVTVISRGEPLR